MTRLASGGAGAGRTGLGRMRSAGAGPVAGLALTVVALAGCAYPTPSGSASGGGAAEPAAVSPLPPPGYGTLTQQEISLSLRSGDLQLMVTPLAESVLVATAPDTYRRLSSLGSTWRGAEEEGSLFLVSFFSSQPNTRFVPEEVQFVSGGMRSRPREIHPVTPSWGARRVAQRETAMAVYVFDRPIDLDSDLVLEYGLEQNAQWSVILPRIQAERARARARAGFHRF